MKKSKKGRRSVDSSKSSGDKTLSSKSSSIRFDILKRWDELREEMSLDNYIYKVYDDLTDKAIEKIREKRVMDERIEAFVESFCNAWLKLVKWRWMMKDDREDVVRFDVEPPPCPKDPWSSYFYEDPTPTKTRTKLPAPLRCNPHPPFQFTQEQSIDKPQVERVIRTHWSDIVTKKQPKEPKIAQKTIINKKMVSLSMPQSYLPNIKNIAFPYRIKPSIFITSQETECKKGTLKKNSSLVNFIDVQEKSAHGTNQKEFICSLQQYSRIDL